MGPTRQLVHPARTPFTQRRCARLRSTGSAPVALARGPLHSCYAEALRANWRRPKDSKDQFTSASICGNNCVVFNVGGNKYRLVVQVQHQAGIVCVKYIGTHVQYDRSDVETVNHY